jgi:hypothetical protein
MKTCSKCGGTKAHSDFSTGSKYKDGFRPWCKGCYSTYNAEYRAKNIDRLKEYSKSYYSAEEVKIRNRASVKLWKKNNPEIVKKAAERYRVKHREEINARHREREKRLSDTDPNYYYNKNIKAKQKNPEWFKQYVKTYHAKHRQELTGQYVMQLFNKRVPKERKIYDVPQALIEAKRIQLLIKRRVKNENDNNITK